MLSPQLLFTSLVFLKITIISKSILKDNTLPAATCLQAFDAVDCVHFIVGLELHVCMWPPITFVQTVVLCL